MFRFAFKNMAIKKIQIALIIISVVISAGVAVLAFNIGEQVSDGITGTAAYYSAIIGPSGSQTQLAMNTMYFADTPLGTIPYDIVSELLQDSRVVSAVPFAMADSYNGFSCVGTTSEYLKDKHIAQGQMFDDYGTLEVVVGSAVAEICELHIGEEIYTSHAIGDEHHTPLKVVGILEPSHTAFDNVVFTQLKTIWSIHEEEEDENAEYEHEEEHDHAHTASSVCAVLIKTTNPGTAMNLVNEYNGRVFTDEDGDVFTIQAIEPMSTVRSILEDADNTKYIVFALCAIILIMNVIIISVITLLNMYNSAKEISLMRLIGISMGKINMLYIIQNSFIGLASVFLALGFSRLCLIAAQNYVSGMGIVMDMTKIYPLEWAILAGVFIISVLPTVICTYIMSHKDGINE